MKKLIVTIELTIKGDLNDKETIQEDVYQQLQELMEEGDLTFEVTDPDEDGEEFGDTDEDY